MIEIQKITESAERHLAGTDLFVVECRCSAGNEIELTVDGDTSVSIDACAALSRAVEADLDREEEDFSLTVMSAGIGSELRCLRQYRRLIGSSVEVLLNNGVKLLAKLDGADERASTSPTKRNRPSRARSASSWSRCRSATPSARSNTRRSISTSSSN